MAARSGWPARAVAGLWRIAPWRVWLFLLLMLTVGWITTIDHRVLFTGDTRYYAASALTFAGYGHAEALRMMQSYVAAFHMPLPSSDVLFDQSSTNARVVYPALSAPFVRLFGIDGMGVIPAVAAALAFAVMLATGSRRWGWRLAVPPLVLLATSSKTLLFCASMITESLSIMWCALLLMVALARPQGGRSTAVLLALLTLGLGFTRQATLIPAGAFCLAWLALAIRDRAVRNRWAVPAVVVTLTAVVVQVLQLLIWPGYSLVRQWEYSTRTTSVAGALRASPHQFWKIISTDTQTLAAADLPLLVLILATLLAWLLVWRRVEVWLSIGALIGAYFYNVTNGTPSGFRYEMPAIPFMVLCVSALLAHRPWDPVRTPASEPTAPVRAVVSEPLART